MNTLMKISVLHASCRPQKAVEMAQKWVSLAKNPKELEYIFCFDDVEKTQNEMSFVLDGIKKLECKCQMDVLPYRLGCVNKLNKCAELATGDIFVQSSEDTMPPQDWDDMILNAADWSKPAVLDCGDGHEDYRPHQPDLLRCTILNRLFYDKTGYIHHPDFYHVFADDWFTYRAKKENAIVPSKHIVIAHLHPFYQKGESDEFYTRANTDEQYMMGNRIFESLKNADSRS